MVFQIALIAYLLSASTSNAEERLQLPQCDKDDIACHRFVDQIRLKGTQSPSPVCSEFDNDCKRGANKRQPGAYIIAPSKHPIADAVIMPSARVTPTLNQLKISRRFAWDGKCKNTFAGVLMSGQNRAMEDLLCRVQVLEERIKELEQIDLEQSR